MEDYNYGYNDDLFNSKNVHLFESIETLIQKVQEDIRTERSLKNSNKHAEYLALQNQINPHFLYNTLEGIRSDALNEGVENIASIIESLAVYFRYTISKIDKLVTLDEELANLDNYLVIQNYRFGDRISMIEIFDDCDRSIGSHLIPKLILQPFIENSIIHGLEEKVGPGLIKIIFSITEELLLITIEDDGVGISEIKLKELNYNLNTLSSLKEEENTRGGIAIKNVNNRIKLLFGEKFGIKIRSIKNFGTSVDIVLPLNKVRNQSPSP
jgi:two-component system sensor histidine kinase YesM